jgi:hypothetical protein
LSRDKALSGTAIGGNGHTASDSRSYVLSTCFALTAIFQQNIYVLSTYLELVYERAS